jgi:hypothetical protein
VAGVVTTKDGAKSYLLSPAGIDYAELVEKSIMGATFYFQATGVYLSEEKTGDAVDNTTVKSGEGTPMEHHWDEASATWACRATSRQYDRADFLGRLREPPRRPARLQPQAHERLPEGPGRHFQQDMKGKNEAIPTIAKNGRR